MSCHLAVRSCDGKESVPIFTLSFFTHNLTFSPKTGEPRNDQARVVLEENVRAESKSLEDAGSEGVDENVGTPKIIGTVVTAASNLNGSTGTGRVRATGRRRSEESSENGDTGGRFQREGNGSFAAGRARMSAIEEQ
jgi:hypothetical protein